VAVEAGGGDGFLAKEILRFQCLDPFQVAEAAVVQSGPEI
jgi:hypothetical protein